jgi:hypothetical protein
LLKTSPSKMGAIPTAQNALERVVCPVPDSLYFRRRTKILRTREVSG